MNPICPTRPAKLLGLAADSSFAACGPFPCHWLPSGGHSPVCWPQALATIPLEWPQAPCHPHSLVMASRPYHHVHSVPQPAPLSFPRPSARACPVGLPFRPQRGGTAVGANDVRPQRTGARLTPAHARRVSPQWP